MKLCVETGKLIRAYLDVALRTNKGSDSISNCEELTQELIERLRFRGSSWSGKNGELFAAIENLRKGDGLPAIEEIRTLCAV
jgi:hypothetical protein